MCSNKLEDDIPSNKEIVSEIVENITKSTMEDEESKDAKPSFVIEPNDKEICADHGDTLSQDFNRAANINDKDPAPPDFDKSDSENEHEIEKDGDDKRAEDFIDEPALKELESILSSEELQARHKEAIELKVKGNEQFKLQLFIESDETYTKALRLCPLEHKSDRAILYSNRAASKMKLKRLKSAIEDCSKAVELNPTYVRAYLRRAKLYEDTEKLDESLEDYKKILELDPGNREALAATVKLPPLIEERNEKMKAEMLGKLKDLGNMILRPFGLSTDNFQLQKDQNTGGYSVNFQQSVRK